MILILINFCHSYMLKVEDTPWGAGIRITKGIKSNSTLIPLLDTESILLPVIKSNTLLNPKNFKKLVFL